MRIDSTKLNGACSCGRTHEMKTRAAIIESGAMERFDDYMKEFGITGTRAVIYDRNTYEAKNLVRPAADLEVILDPEGLHANEKGTAAAAAALEGHAPDVLVAVGSGTIHDITRYTANRLGIPFISCPTAASVDGFCSTVSAMTWGGCKKTLPGVAPEIVIADTKVLKEAPMRLSLSGIGDIIGKYTALADWKITHAVNGEHFCSRINDLTMDAVKAVYACCEKVAARDEEAVGQLIYALLLSGLAMQLMGNSRPASGAEHHISHLIEMEPESLGVHSGGLHGEKVGVGTIMISRLYHKLGEITDIAPYLVPYETYTEEELKSFYGDFLFPGVLDENRPDAMDDVTPEMVKAAWPEIRRIIAEIPSAEELEALYTKTGMKKTPEDIDVPSAYADRILYFSPSVRRRITFNRMSRMFRL